MKKEKLFIRISEIAQGLHEVVNQSKNGITDY